MDFNRLQPKDVARKYRKKFSACGASLAFPFGEGEPIRDGETPCPFALQILVAVDEVQIVKTAIAVFDVGVAKLRIRQKPSADLVTSEHTNPAGWPRGIEQNQQKQL